LVDNGVKISDQKINDYINSSKIKLDIREGSLTALSKLQVLKDMGVDPKRLVDSKANIFESTIKSVMSPPDSIENVDVRDVDTEHLTVAQNFFDTLIRMKDGSILKLKGAKAEEVYRYLQKATKGSNAQPEPEKLNKLVEFLDPSHGFIGIEKGSTIYPIGFYPKSDTNAEDIIAGDFRTETAVACTLFTGSFIGISIGMNLMAEVANNCGYNYGTQTYIPSLLAGVATVLEWYMIGENIRYVDHKLGRIAEEVGELQSADEKNSLKVSFVMTEEQTQKLESYVETLKKSCDNKSAEHCLYFAPTKNSVTFIQDAFRVAGLEGDPFDYFSEEQLANGELNSFAYLYAHKALLFVRITSQELAAPQDKFMEMEDYLHAHPALAPAIHLEA